MCTSAENIHCRKSEENWILPEAPTYQETKIEIPEILKLHIPALDVENKFDTS